MRRTKNSKNGGSWLLDPSLSVSEEMDAEATAFVDQVGGKERLLSFREARTLLGQYVAQLLQRKSHGLSIAVVCSANRFEVILLLLALHKCEITVCLQSGRLDQRFIDRDLQLMDPGLILYDSSNACDTQIADLSRRYPCVDMSDFHAGIQIHEGVKSRFASEQDLVVEEDALVLFTSGSQGLKKGVVFTREALSHWCSKTKFQQRMVGRSVLIPASVEHISSLNMCLSALQAGRPVILSQAFDPGQVLNTVRRWNIRHFSGTATMMRMILEKLAASSGFADFTLDSVLLFGEPVPASLRNEITSKLRCRLLNPGYGLTEAGGSVFAAQDTSPESLPADSCGRIVRSDLTVSLRNEYDEEDDTGTLWVSTPRAASRYLNDPEASAKTFLDGWMKTKDKFEKAADGFFTYIERTDDMLMVSGRKYFTNDMKEILRKHPLVSDAVVVCVDDEIGKVQIVAFVLLTERLADPEQSLKRYCYGLQSAPRAPDIVIAIDKWPLLASGKLDTARLRSEAKQYLGKNEELAQSRQFAGEHDLCLLVACAFEKVFGISIQPTDDFGRLGGDSLFAVLLSSEITAAADVEVSVEDIYANPVVSDLASFIALLLSSQSSNYALD